MYVKNIVRVQQENQMIDKYGYPIPRDTPEAIRATCIPRSYWWNDWPATQQHKPDDDHPIPQSTRDMYDNGCGHALPATVETKTGKL